MKKIYGFFVILFCLFLSAQVTAQAYRKGSLLISVSEGSTWANYSTSDISGPKPTLIKTKCMDGVRDPLIIEYGISNRWSIGLSSGTDIFKVTSSDFYKFSTSDEKVKVSTGEFTIDGTYHVFVNKRLDLSVFTSVGFLSINFKGNDNDVSYKYTANGNIIRLGGKARYYFFKRLGAFGMVSSYAASCSPKDVKGNTVANNYSTSINGFAIEAGLCFRILR